MAKIIFFTLFCFVIYACNALWSADAVISIKETFKQVKTFDIDRYGVEEIIFSPDGKYLSARGFGGNVIWLWKL